MKTILFTGSTDGIGLAACRQLVALGHRVLMHGRNPTKLQSFGQELGVDTFAADLSDMKQVYQLSQDVQAKHAQIDVLVNNAGVFKLDPTATTTPDGLDTRIAVNLMAPYILTQQLLPILAPEGRVINLASAAQAPVALSQALSLTPNSYASDFQAYAQSKLGVIQWTNVLAAAQQQQPDSSSKKIQIVSLNPASMIGTKMVKEGFGVNNGKDLSVGADILVEAAVGDSFVHANGKYYDNDLKRFGSPHPDAMDMESNQQLVRAMNEWLEAKQFPHNWN